ncbi:hypothetical protein M427DRAFT_50845 [Gonapodya prolifera JEL478]|uniref:Uncharacterized protein n=1 Tax=Gonapodya prolifera (strain JEL478) TaxID=1344416 RepID=A0A139B0M1_GONPJ|nr:hypothetical protein M427DRAFT_50845 [Gonapodya prolifera JEL478]|eukprot:KXS22546.1 hypothetical protein M427DRAFT_50845 [Gonapodya prolifera JEL478]
MASLPPPLRPTTTRRVCKRSMFSTLRDREAGLHAQQGSRRPNTNSVKQRQLTWNVHPDITFYDVRMPPGCQQLHFRKFSPDGKCLVAFSKSNHSLVILRYLGPGCSSTSTRGSSKRDTSNPEHAPMDNISNLTPIRGSRPSSAANGTAALAAEDDRLSTHSPTASRWDSPFGDSLESQRVFSDFFSVEYEVNVTAGTEVLCKEFSLFSEDGKFLVLASAVPSSTPPLEENSGSLTSIQQLDDVTFWVVELAHGTIVDKRTFKSDYIYLSNHAGVSLLGNRLLITSVQNQTVYMMEIMPSGRLNHVRSLGTDLLPDDGDLLRDLNNRELEWRRTSESVSILKSSPPSTPETRVRPSGSVLGKRQRPVEDEGEDLEDNELGPPPSTRPTFRANIRRLAVPSITTGPSSDVPTLASGGGTSPPGSWSPAWTTGSGSRLQTRTTLRSIGAASQRLSSGTPNRPLTREDPPNDLMLSGLKHRLMAFLHRRAMASGDINRLRHFFLSWDYFASLVIWRCEWMDAATIVFKMGGVDAIGKSDPPAAAPTFLLIFHLPTVSVVGFHESCSPDLLDWYETDDRWRRQATSRVNWCASMSNSDKARETVRKSMFGLWKAKNGGSQQAIKRALANLPHNPQAYSETPYWDQELFSYDEKSIGPLERPKVVVDFPLKWFNRVTGEHVFSIDPFPKPYGIGPPRTKHYAVFIFHPTDPFCITVMFQAQQQTAVNIHARRCVG